MRRGGSAHAGEAVVQQIDVQKGVLASGEGRPSNSLIVSAACKLAPGLTVPILWLVLVSGCVGSYMPRSFRHWSILDGTERWSMDGRRP